MALTRRAYLATGAAALTLSTASVSASSEEYDVSVDFPEEWLRRYRPAFVSDYQTLQRSAGLYAHRARDASRSTDVAVFWHRLTHQDGLPLVSSDAHVYDHEPVYVFVDDAGAVDRVTYSAYHHFQNTVSGTALASSLRADETTEETHVELEIVDPWHHYLIREDPESVSYLDLEGDADASHLDTWETREIFASTAGEAVYDPWSVEARGSWWDKSTLDYQVASTYRRLGELISIGGSERSDLE